MRVLWAHLQDEPPDPSIGYDDIPAGFVQALKTALRKEPVDRPSSSVEYVRSLLQAAGLPTQDA
jgi:hypothetical protein